MDRQPEKLRFQGINIFSESMRIISIHWRILFTITRTLILPLSFLFLFLFPFHARVCNFLFKLLNLSDDDWIVKVAYFILLLLLSVPSTSASAYIVACSYLNKKITYIKVISAVPKNLAKSVLLFSFIILVFIVHTIVTIFLAWSVVAFFFIFSSSEFTSTILILEAILFVLYLIGISYIGAIWQLSRMIAIFEECFEGVAIIKSMTLMRGKMLATMATSFVVNFYLVGSQYLFYKYVVNDWSMGTCWKVVLIVFSSVLFCLIFAFWGVVQTVTYFVCKSYHNEDIDKSALSDRLEVYVGNYVDVDANDISFRTSLSLV